MDDYSFAQKNAFVDTMRLQMAEINREIDQLAANIEKSSDAVKAEAKPKLEALRDRVAQLNERLEGVKDATESTWESAKEASKTAYGELKHGFRQARQWLSDNIAPPKQP